MRREKDLSAGWIRKPTSFLPMKARNPTIFLSLFDVGDSSHEYTKTSEIDGFEELERDRQGIIEGRRKKEGKCQKIVPVI